MRWEVRIAYKKGVQDTEGESTLEGLRALGFERVDGVTTARVYLIEGDYSKREVEEMCRRLLANPISQDYKIKNIGKGK
ncbi:MAG: phosphoribosylformylglycinamidine synthase subunit PurS [Candidatus Hydrothermarchaeaceae archaeon]